MSQDLLIPFIPNINHTRPMSKQELQVNRVTKRPIAKKDEEHRSETEQMETLTYLDALRQQMREAHDEATAQQSLFEESSDADNSSLKTSKHGLAKALEQAGHRSDESDSEGKVVLRDQSAVSSTNHSKPASQPETEKNNRSQGRLDLFA